MNVKRSVGKPNAWPWPNSTKQEWVAPFYFVRSKTWKIETNLFFACSFFISFFFSTAGPSYVVGSSFVSSIRIHEPHPDECWGFLLPPSSSCFVFILTLTYSPSSSSIVVGYCLDRFLLFFLLRGISFCLGMWRASCLIDWNWRCLPFFISRRIGTD